MTETVAFLTGNEAEQRLSGDRARFWQLVTDAVCQVFDRDDAGIVDGYRREVEAEASRQERLLVYHSSPLHIAADLAGVDEIGDAQVCRFLEIERRSLRDAGITEAA